ncbi:MAG: aldo/keto reductase [Gammaproteobacteria bacterium]|nr:aldo/keto reductase [Gammaproteobacteria bacterium]
MSTQPWITTSVGINMPCFIYGTAWKKARTADLVVQALLAGFKGIDTAGQPKHYDETLVGVGLQRAKQQGIPRETLYLQTKFTSPSGQDPNHIPYDKTAPIQEQVAQSFAKSQQNLQTDYVDGLILHSPFATHAQTLQAWRALETIQRAGGARQLGISNCYNLNVLQALYTDAKIKPAIVQNRFYKDTGYDVALRHWCTEYGIIYQSFWTLTANPHILNSETVRNLAAHHHQTPAKIFFRYLHQVGIVPLTGTKSEQHMQEDLAIFDFSLTGDEVIKLSLLLQANTD